MKKVARKITAFVLSLLCISMTSFATVTKTEMEEGEELWNAFLEAVAPVETDEQYAELLNITDLSAEFFSSYYEEVTGKPADEYVNMPSFERFLWDYTYVHPALTATYGDYDFYLSTLENFFNHGVDACINEFESLGSEDMYDAYKALMKWDYNYFLAHGCFYCFMEGKDSFELNGIGISSVGTTSEAFSEEDVDEIVSALENEGMTKDEVREVVSALEDEGMVSSKNDGIWGNTKTFVKKDTVTIVIFVFLAVATCGVVIYRKRQGRNEDGK